MLKEEPARKSETSAVNRQASNNTEDPQGNHEATWKVRPLITPDAFNSEPSASWDEWIRNFESVAKVNEWDEDVSAVVGSENDG